MKSLLFIGSLNKKASYFEEANGKGLLVHLLDDHSFASEELAIFPDIVNPTYLSPSHDGRYVYVNSEIEHWCEGLVTAFSFNWRERSLQYLNMQPSKGSITAHNAIVTQDSRLYVANYGMYDDGPDQSVTVYPIMHSGGIGAPISSIRQVGSSVNVLRQTRSHVHSVTHVGEKLILVADLGNDTLTIYDTSRVDLLKIAEKKVAAGSGPRHACAHESGNFIYVVNELNSTVTAYSLILANRELQEIGHYPTVEADFEGDNHPADIQLSPDGNYLYVTNRGSDTIMAYAVDRVTGSLTLMRSYPCGGRTPRSIAISPRGKLLLCANQDSDKISIFERNIQSGDLRDTGESILTGTPMCVRFAREFCL